MVLPQGKDLRVSANDDHFDARVYMAIHHSSAMMIVANSSSTVHNFESLSSSEENPVKVTVNYYWMRTPCHLQTQPSLKMMTKQASHVSYLLYTRSCNAFKVQIIQINASPASDRYTTRIPWSKIYVFLSYPTEQVVEHKWPVRNTQLWSPDVPF